MDHLEAGKLLATAAAFDNRRPSKVAAHAWAAALHDLPADPDCFAAVARFYTEPATGTEADGRRWIEPHHVRYHRTKIRNERIPDGAFTHPDPAGNETGAEFVQRRRAQIQAIADGRLDPQPIREITGGPHPSVTATATRIGQIPEHLRAEFAAAGIGAKRGQWPELAIPCPLHSCRALAWNPCRSSKGRRMRQGTHPSRRDEWQRQQDQYVVSGDTSERWS
jgi:hypothetical protein